MNSCERCQGEGFILSAGLRPCPSCQPCPGLALPEAVRRVVDEIAAERKRQIEVEGWTEEHDDQLCPGELADAGVCYGQSAADYLNRQVVGLPVKEKPMPGRWPWNRKWWKPKDPRRDLIRAAALIVAEIERMDRAALAALAPHADAVDARRGGEA